MDTVDEIKQRLDIVQVISGYLPDLKKSGRNFKAVCPFHAEKTPSFFVFPDRQSWHCFGACGTGGDVFAFVMRREGVDFKDALAILAEKAGVPLVQPKLEEGQTEAGRLRHINDAAAGYFHDLLFHSAGGQRTREYLGRRGVSEQTMRRFQLGYSLDSWDSLRQELMKRGYRESELLAAGLLVQKEPEGSYDRFRQRLMFPIRDAAGRVIGFGARALDDSLPKYLNSPQTLVFDKSGCLYGIDFARETIRKENLAVVVEGYMDVIVAHQHGFANVVASLGTALTEKHVGIVKKLTNRLVLALDADAAGQMATLRGIQVAGLTFDQKMVPVPTSAGLVTKEQLDAEIRVMVLPAGKDPDDVIRESPGEWARLLAEAPPVVDYTFDLVLSRLDVTRVGDKTQAMRQLLPLVAEIKHPVRQAHYVQKLARMVGMDEKKVYSELAQVEALAPGPRRREAGPAPASRPAAATSPGDLLAGYCLYLLFSYPDLRGHASDLRVDYFPNTKDREVFLAWRGAGDMDSLRGAMEATLVEHLDSITSRSLPPLHGPEQETALRQCSNRLRERWLKDLKAKEQVLISELEAAGKPTDLQEIQESAVKFNAELGEVFRHGKEKRKRAPG